MKTPAFRTFLGLDAESSDADRSFATILPLPLEKSVRACAGTSGGPASFLEASQTLEPLDLHLGIDLRTVGVATLSPPDLDSLRLDEALRAIEQLVVEVAQEGAWPLAVGGEQSLSLGMARGLRRLHGPLSILHLGPRPDFLDSRDGSRLSHRSVLRRLSEDGFEIASLGTVEAHPDELEAMRERGVFFHVSLPDARPPDEDALFRALGPRVYLSIDLGVFGPNAVPGTSFPEARAGLDPDGAQRLIERLFREREVVGADLCELRPLPNDPRGEVFAAALARRLIALASRHRLS